MFDCKKEVEKRVTWIKSVLDSAGAKGIVIGMSGGKDCALVGILATMATDNVTGIIMPCEAKQNYLSDRDDAILLNKKFKIRTLEVDLTSTKQELRKVLYPLSESQYEMAYANINPRLRMIVLYNYAQRENYLVAGTGNLSERTMGYFTKWGDGAYDFNPIGDLTVKEVYILLKYLNCPEEIIRKEPSAGLIEGQTDEKDFGITYAEIDKYIMTKQATEHVKSIVDNAYNKTKHKRFMGRIYPE